METAAIGHDQLGQEAAVFALAYFGRDLEAPGLEGGALEDLLDRSYERVGLDPGVFTGASEAAGTNASMKLAKRSSVVRAPAVTP